MIRPPKLYLKRKDIPLQSLYDLKEAEGAESKAGVYNSKLGPRVDQDTRSTTLKKLDYDLYPDINQCLLNMVQIWDGTLDPKDYYVGEYNYLIYNEGDHFTKHKDVINNGSNKVRIFSTSTIISYTEDFEGGEFRIWSNDGFNQNIDLQPGETVFFDSNTQHQVFPVKKGTREVLVAWIYKK